MTRYAAETKVSPERSLDEIKRTLIRYGATAFIHAEEVGKAVMIGFQVSGLSVRIHLPLPEYEEFRVPPADYTRAAANQAEQATDRAYQQAIAQRWRALSLYIKAKVEGIESGIVTLEEAFLAHIILPDGRTLAQWAGPQIQAAIEGGRMPPLLPGGEG